MTPERLEEIKNSIRAIKRGNHEHFAVNAEYYFRELVQEIHDLNLDKDRLKAGLFTEEEFQNLCHTFSEDDECRFKAGCEAYQRKLFGTK